jgi:low affinity Fe/Cu permease
MNEIFHKFASTASEVLGSAWVFILAVASIAVWAFTGPIFHFSDTWQLLANTGTTLVTFLMVFLIQNTQNRDAKAIHLKLDELIRAVEGARTGLVDLEDLSDKDLARLQKQFQGMHEQMGTSSIKLDKGRLDAEAVEADEVKAGHVEAKKIVTEQDDEHDEQDKRQEPTKRRRR